MPIYVGHRVGNHSGAPLSLEDPLKNTHKTRCGGPVAVGTVGAVGLLVALTQMPAHGSTAEPTVTSAAVASQSMVPVSSWTSLGDSPLAATLAGKAAGAASDAADNPNVVTRVRFQATIKKYDAKGDLIRTRRINRRVLGGHGTIRVGPVAGGTATAAMGWTGSSTVGADQWEFTSYLKFSWDHRQCPCTMNMINKGTTWKIDDRHWRWAGVAQSDNHYVAGSGGPHTYYHHMMVGEFDGSDLLGNDVTEYPRITLDAYNDGTFEFWRSCDC
jgi:hypothetical protein